MKIRTFFNAVHWVGKTEQLRVLHGPQTWPWWRLVSFHLCNLHIYPPSTGYRVWLYTRWGALYWDIHFDRRAVRK